MIPLMKKLPKDQDLDNKKKIFFLN